MRLLHFSPFLSENYMFCSEINIQGHGTFVVQILLSSTVRYLPLLYTSFLTYRKLVQFSCSVVSDSLWPHEPQHARPPCPSPIPRVYSNARPSSQRCHPTISSSVVPFSSCPQSFRASGSFAMSQFFTSSGQSTGVSISTSVPPMNTQDWSPLGWTG